MAEAAERGGAAGAAVAFALLPPMLRLSVRGDQAAAEAVGRGFGVVLPREACRAAVAGERAALWLGPDEWLLLSPDGPPEALVETLAAGVARQPAGLVDISHRQLGIAVTGPRAADVLNAFNALDLAPEAFPAGMCTRTLFGKAEIVLWRRAPEDFHLEAGRSFAPYVLGLLEEAAREYGSS